MFRKINIIFIFFILTSFLYSQDEKYNSLIRDSLGNLKILDTGTYSYNNFEILRQNNKRIIYKNNIDYYENMEFLIKSNCIVASFDNFFLKENKIQMGITPIRNIMLFNFSVKLGECYSLHDNVFNQKNIIICLEDKKYNAILNDTVYKY